MTASLVYVNANQTCKLRIRGLEHERTHERCQPPPTAGYVASCQMPDACPAHGFFLDRGSPLEVLEEEEVFAR